jgi:hypothetical protein
MKAQRLRVATVALMLIVLVGIIFAVDSVGGGFYRLPTLAPPL